MITSLEMHEGELLGGQSYTLTEFCEICRLDRAFVLELMEYDVITSINTSNTRFSHTDLNRAMKAWRLQRDLELNPPGVALVIQLLEQIDEQEKELKTLRRLLVP